MRLAAADAEAAVDVLLGNVFAHTPEGAPYALSVRAADGRVCSSWRMAAPASPTAISSSTVAPAPEGLRASGSTSRAAAARAAGGELRVDTSEALGGARVVLDLPRAEDAR